jgi:hypothetical protein
MENNYQLSRIHNYVHGLMNRAEMHALEREALEDPFLQDAIDGYKLQQGVDAKQLSILQQRLATRVQEQATDKNRRFYSWQRLAVGMAAGVMFMVVCTLLLMKYLPNQKQATLTEVEIMPIKEYNVKIYPSEQNKGIPVQGWNDIEEKISKSVENLNISDGREIISLKFDRDGKVIEGGSEHSSLLDLDSSIIYEILESVKWKGESTVFTIEINRKEL